MEIRYSVVCAQPFSVQERAACFEVVVYFIVVADEFLEGIDGYDCEDDGAG